MVGELGESFSQLEEGLQTTIAGNPELLDQNKE